MLHSPEPAAKLCKLNHNPFASPGLISYKVLMKNAIQKANQSAIRTSANQVDSKNILPLKIRANTVKNSPVKTATHDHEDIVIDIQDIANTANDVVVDIQEIADTANDVVVNIQDVAGTANDDLIDIIVGLDSAEQDDLSLMSEFAGGSKKHT